MPKVSSLSALELIALRRNHGRVSLTEDDVDEAKAPESDKPGKLGGWIGTLYLGSVGAFTALILNLIMVCWASTRSRHSSEGESVLYAGGCDRTKRISTVVHLVINILGAGLLSASNYAMQCLSAPTRDDVNRAHAKGQWLDIGVPSARNLARIPRSRMFLWLCLVASSAPLHLFYNSTVYATISANGYDVFVANSSFTSFTPSDVTTVYDEDYKLRWDGNRDVSATRIVASAQAGNLTHMAPQECISAYATSWQSKHGSLVIISDAFNGSMSAIQLVERQLAPWVGNNEDDPFGWICADERRAPTPDHRCQYYLGDVKSKANSSWVVKGYKVEYCLVETVAEKCTLEFSLPLAIVVIATNLIKAVLIVLASLVLGSTPLLTVGDAVASFLRVPDERTKGRCLLTRDTVVKERRNMPLATCRSYSVQQEPAHEPEEEPPTNYSAERRRRWSSLSAARWLFSFFTSISSLVIALSLLLYGFHQIKLTSSTDGLWSSGLAAVDTRTMINTIDWPSSLIPNALLANMPQLIFSALYFTLNSILTTMALSTEWNSFSITRKGLRVSTPPQGHQRTTYFLSLPYRYSIPLLGLSAVLHWLMSQSIFLVRVLARDSHLHRFSSRDTTTIGYSPPAIVAGLCVGLLLPLGVLGFGARRFKSGMPIAGSCSLAIAAACHPAVKRYEGEDGLGIEYKRLKWGVVSYKAEADSGEIGHCAFSASKVDPPEDRMLYR
ncbi:hypothetical protein BDW71DRAFT_180947 [Aspergillus fruticulosus]